MVKKFQFNDLGPPKSVPRSNLAARTPKGDIVLTRTLSKNIHYHRADAEMGLCGATKGAFTTDTMSTKCRTCWAHLAHHGMVPSATRAIELRIKPLDAETVDGIVSAVKTGSTIETAAALYDLPTKTMHHWFELGARILEGETLYLTTEEDLARRLVSEVRQALARFEATLVENIRKAGQVAKHWQANSWLLEKRFPSLYGKKAELQAKLEITGGAGAQAFDPSKLSDEQLKQLDKLLSTASGVIDVTPVGAIDMPVDAEIERI